ncbi:hypothetical protein H9P43_004513 [Blastocladiella emersonii ATCC 22665]|nr:hypothetical protein H9P43_004513 [Blastocladiella emersonii ATCC 22665]
MVFGSAAPATTDPLLDLEHGEWLTLRDGHVVYARTWEVPHGVTPRATLTWVHGLGEHIERYRHVFMPLAAAGFRVHAWDQRGFGRTVRKNAGAELGHTGGWPVVLADVREAVERNAVDGLPQFLVGHSMGGLIVLDFLRQFGSEVMLAGVISSAPAIDVWPASKPAAPAVALLRVVKHIIPAHSIANPVELHGLCHDDAAIAAYRADPLVHGYLSLIAGEGILDAGAALRAPGATFAAKSVPLLLVHGDRDPITYAPATQAFAAARVEEGWSDVTFKMYHGFKHELHNEQNLYETLVGDYIAWLSDRC